MIATETLEEFYKRHPEGSRTGFSLNNAGQGHLNVFKRNGWCYNNPFGRRDFYKISLVIGSGKIHYLDKEVVIDKPALVFVSPLVPSKWETDPTSEQGGWFCLFTQAFVESHDHKSTLQDYPLFKVGGNHIIFLNDAQLGFFSATLKRMMDEMESDYPNKYDLQRNYLHILMHEALKIAPDNPVENITNAAARITASFLELLERQFPIDSPGQHLKLKTANDYAQNLSVHTNHLNRSVKDVTGKTTTQHISERVLKEAHALLKYTDWSIAQIANGLGFDEPAYFTNFFKKYTGSSPAISRLATV